MSVVYGKLELMKGNKMTNKSEAQLLLAEALKVMTEKNEANGMSWGDASRNAYAGMFGMLGLRTSKAYAKKVLEIAKEW
jgi:hypothetical protein